MMAVLSLGWDKDSFGNPYHELHPKSYVSLKFKLYNFQKIGLLGPPIYA